MLFLCGAMKQRFVSVNVEISGLVLREMFVRAVDYVEAHKSDLPPQQFALFKV
jgi:hypothetical protein